MTPGDFVAAMPLPALVMRRDARVEAANAGAEALFGPRLTSRHVGTVLRQPALLAAIEGLMRDGARREAEYRGSDGGQESLWRMTGAMLGRDAALLTFTDVTPLEKAGQMRRDFVANVSHELRTPLTAIMGFVETLQGPAANDAAARERFLGIMQKEAQRMNRLVDDLLSLSRVEAEERVRPTAPVRLDALVGETVRGLMPLAEAAGVTLAADGLETAVSVPGDPDQLRQVLANLVENAVKYSGRGAAITVTLAVQAHAPRLRGPGVRLSVRDTGPGIDPLHIPRLTERFYRVDSHRAREMGGTGLGLAIVKHIVSRHRGHLAIESALGRGSTFSVLLPSG